MGLGAAVIVAVSVVPVVGLIAPLLGGGFAGWNAREPPSRAAMTGAGAGVLASAVSFPVVVAASLLLASASLPAAVAVLAVAVAVGLYVVGLGALGGYAGRGASAASADGDGHRSDVARLREQYVDGTLTDTELERRIAETLGDDAEQNGPFSRGGDRDTEANRRASRDENRDTAPERR